jgi:multidrug transporter EmrE-like cation transporter
MGGVLVSMAGDVSFTESPLVELVLLGAVERKIMKHIAQLPAWFYMTGFVAFQVGGSMLLRVASQRTGGEAIGLFFLGNLVGFCGATFLTLALRTQHPNLTFAICQGGAFCILQLACYAVFRVPMTSAQWVGVALIACGILSLQFSRT